MAYLIRKRARGQQRAAGAALAQKMDPILSKNGKHRGVRPDKLKKDLIRRAGFGSITAETEKLNNRSEREDIICHRPY